ncbi:hypothetical protein [Pedobacter alluvionis]|uniref:Uncharacterized protein n=1 Tax=Pedobacter alluvionis TaxID=475253 RepID=A0A497XY61_9SPHI|nr:hypothetical protein [Pedobacter alluvionis]RLJ75140.1 hypothetical protein BCL90_3489 [Pedobacter alluvionis]TFB30244.1 hypothetical protein E3V97_18925 [Pedobacter alluvionis]
MGHSIIAFKNDTPIARLRFGATNYAMSSYLYKVLNAEDYNNGMSGNGKSRIYNYENILNAKAAIAYYEKEPFEMVRNIENEQRAELFLGSFLGFGDTRQEHFSTSEISEAISNIKEFLSSILNSEPFAEIKISFG